MVAPFIGGIVLDWMGYQKGVQIFMVVEFLVAFVVTYFRWRMLRETIDLDDKPRSGEPSQRNLCSTTAAAR